MRGSKGQWGSEERRGSKGRWGREEGRVCVYYNKPIKFFWTHNCKLMCPYSLCRTFLGEDERYPRVG